jgi:biotin synthase
MQVFKQPCAQVAGLGFAHVHVERDMPTGTVRPSGGRGSTSSASFVNAPVPGRWRGAPTDRLDLFRLKVIPTGPVTADVDRSSVDDRAFEAALSRGRTADVDLGSALTLFYGAIRQDRARRLFRAAAHVRDAMLGRRLKLTAHLHMVTGCALSPSCKYCSLSSSIPSVSEERSQLTAREVIRGVRFAAKTGVKSIVLVGGTDFEGSDARLRKLIPRVREVTDLDLAVDLGPSLSEGTVRWLGDQGVNTIYCSMETIDEKAFAAAKPGDDLVARLKFMEMVERAGGHLGNVVMNGLGTVESLLRTLLESRRFPHTTHLHISTFHPVRGTPWALRRPASLRSSLRVLAIARLAFPDLQLGLAEVGVENPKDLTSVSSQLEAGAGNTFAGALIYKNVHIDNMEWIRAQASSLGFEAS